MKSGEILEADLTWTGEAFEAGVQVVIGADGRIEAVGRLGVSPTHRLAGRAILPGMVSAHSHAFQRGLRGSGERFPQGAGSFWTWREAMYALVESLDAEAFRRLSVRAFLEMRDAGITAVGEFHYFHHSPRGPDWAFDRLILEAAAEAGIRIVLLGACYRTGAIGEPLGPAQRRFAAASLAEYWERMDELAERLDPRTQALGAAAHSIRAVPPDEIADLQAESSRRGFPFHIHVEEQRAEVEACVRAFGHPPMAVLLDTLGRAGDWTAIHCTHTRPEDMVRFLSAGGRICACPLTEANLGDGIPDLSRILGAEGRLSLGTDSNARICMTEEMRWLEYGQRLAGERRGVVVDNQGSTARALLRIATEGGARALGLDAGRLAPGHWADLMVIDPNTPSLVGCDESSLLDAWVFGSGNDAVVATCVAGRWRESRDEDRPRGDTGR